MTRLTTKGPIPPPVTEQIEDISTVLEPPAENAGPIEAFRLGNGSTLYMSEMKEGEAWRSTTPFEGEDDDE